MKNNNHTRRWWFVADDGYTKDVGMTLTDLEFENFYQAFKKERKKQ